MFVFAVQLNLCVCLPAELHSRSKPESNPIVVEPNGRENDPKMSISVYPLTVDCSSSGTIASLSLSQHIHLNGIELLCWNNKKIQIKQWLLIHNKVVRLFVRSFILSFAFRFWTDSFILFGGASETRSNQIKPKWMRGKNKRDHSVKSCQFNFASGKTFSTLHSDWFAYFASVSMAIYLQWAIFFLLLCARYCCCHKVKQINLSRGIVREKTVSLSSFKWIEHIRRRRRYGFVSLPISRL